MRIAISVILIVLALAPVHAQVAAPPPAGLLVQTSIEALVPLRGKVTLSAWRRDHPRESVIVPMMRGDDASQEPRIGDFDQLWCSVAGDTSAPTMGAGLRRRTFFYVPQRVPGATLPSLGARTADDCVLGAIEFTLPPATLTDPVETYGSDSASLAARVGSIADHGSIYWHFYGSRREGIWQFGDVTIGLSETTPDSAGRFTLDLAISGPAFPGDIDFDRMFPPAPGGQRQQRHHAAELDTVLAWSGLDANTRGALVGFADRFARDTGYAHFGATETDRLAVLLGRVVRPQPPVRADQRSARLIAADLMLDAGSVDIGFGEDSDSSSRAFHRDRGDIRARPRREGLLADARLAPASGRAGLAWSGR
jgi:hypothetical protein